MITKGGKYLENTIEIIGSKLARAFDEFNISAKQTYGTRDSEYEVWELSSTEFDKLIVTDESVWEDKLSGSWWREGRCIYQGSELAEFIVNGEQFYGYKSEMNQFDDDEDYEVEDDDEEAIKEDKLLSFDSFTDWLSKMHDLSTERNISIFAMSLAEDNGVKLSEFMTKYQPLESSKK